MVGPRFWNSSAPGIAALERAVLPDLSLSPGDRRCGQPRLRRPPTVADVNVRELTLVAERGAPDDVFEEVRKEFSDEELVGLSLAIVAINSWNRLMIGFQADVGHYQAGDAEKMRKGMRERAMASAG